jgi:hypothetical protein
MYRWACCAHSAPRNRLAITRRRALPVTKIRIELSDLFTGHDTSQVSLTLRFGAEKSLIVIEEYFPEPPP